VRRSIINGRANTEEAYTNISIPPSIHKLKAQHPHNTPSFPPSSPAPPSRSSPPLSLPPPPLLSLSKPHLRRRRVRGLELEEAFVTILWRLPQIGRSIFLGRIFGRFGAKPPNSLLQEGAAFSLLQPLYEPLLVVLGLGSYIHLGKRGHLCIYSFAPSEFALVKIWWEPNSLRFPCGKAPLWFLFPHSSQLYISQSLVHLLA
jgi:hypothetical protein